MKSIFSWFKSKKEQLLDAVKQNDVTLVRKMIAKDINVNYVDIESGRTALHWAVYLGHYDIVNLLAPLHKSYMMDKAGKIPLHLAVNKNDLISVKLLTQYDQNVLFSLVSKDNEGKTPLYYATVQRSAEILQLFYDLADTEKNRKDKSDKYAEIHPAIEDFWEQANKINNALEESSVPKPYYLSM